MVATTNSNVINLQPGGPQVTASANRILLECRDMGARQLRSALREMLQAVAENAQTEADSAVEMDRRRFLSGLSEQLDEKGGRLEGLLASHWTTGFDKALRGGAKPSVGKELSFADLQIVDFDDMEEDLAAKGFAQRLDSKCEADLYALGRRFSYLAAGGRSEEIANPLAPKIIAEAITSSLREAGIDSESRRELWRRFESLADSRVASILHTVNAHLVQHNILPEIKREYGRQAAKKALEASGTPPKDMFSVLQSLVGTASGQATAAPAAAGLSAALTGRGDLPAPSPQIWASLESLQHATPAAFQQAATGAGLTNVLHDFRMSETGQGMQQLDAITVDIVAMLFDMIFDDREISDPIKALVGKLQIPILKVALMDRGFFSSKAHPTRRLLDLISRAAQRWSGAIGHEDPVYRKISEVVDVVHGNFKQDTDLFANLCEDLEAFLTEQEAAADVTTNKAALLVIQRELEELADLAIDRELQPLLERAPCAMAADLLDHEWRTVLRRIHLEDGPTSESWSKALETANQLVDSLTPKHDGQERQNLARLLPNLLRQLSAGFDRIKLEPARRHSLMDALFTIHSALLRGNQPPAEVMVEAITEDTDAEAAPEIATASLGDGEITVSSISVTLPLLAAVAEPGVESLQRGDWVEYLQADGESIRYRLSWISPQRGIFLFTNPQSSNALAVSPEAMSLQLQRGEVRILSTEPIFDRALVRTIDTLQAA